MSDHGYPNPDFQDFENKQVTTPGLLPGQDAHPAAKTMRMLARFDLVLAIGAAIAFVVMFLNIDLAPGSSGLSLDDLSKGMWAMIGLAVVLPLGSLVILKVIIPSMNKAWVAQNRLNG